MTRVLVVENDPGLVLEPEDDLREEISFQEGPDLSQWAGQPVGLRFRLKNASLYSFAFRGSEN